MGIFAAELGRAFITNFLGNLGDVGPRGDKQRSGLKQADFMELVPEKNDRYDTAVTFSSVLEMMKQRRLDAQQQYIFGDEAAR